MPTFNVYCSKFDVMGVLWGGVTTPSHMTPNSLGLHTNVSAMGSETIVMCDLMESKASTISMHSRQIYHYITSTHRCHVLHNSSSHSLKYDIW